MTPLFHLCHVLTSILWFQELLSQTRNVSVQTMNTCLAYQQEKNKVAKGRGERTACKLAFYRDEESTEGDFLGWLRESSSQETILWETGHHQIPPPGDYQSEGGKKWSQTGQYFYRKHKYIRLNRLKLSFNWQNSGFVGLLPWMLLYVVHVTI